MLLKSKSCQLPLKLLFQFHHHSPQILRACHTRLVLCKGHRDIEEFTLTTMQSFNLSHDEWLASLFNSGLPSPELPADFLQAIWWMLMSPFLTLLSLMLELSAWSIGLGQASLELMYLLLLCRVCRFQLVHECLNQAVVQMANLGLDPVHATEFRMVDMLQRSHLLTCADTPPHTPHPVSRSIDFHIGVVGSQIGVDTSFNRSNPDHVNTIADQLQTLVDRQLIDDQGREVEVFDLLGNIRLELLAGSVGVSIVVGSGEPLPESSVHSLDQGETFT